MNTTYIPVNINHDGDSDSRFRCRDGNGEQGKEIPFELSGKKETVKYGKVDICSIQHQFYRDEDSKCVAAGEEPVYSPANIMMVEATR